MLSLDFGPKQNLQFEENYLDCCSRSSAGHISELCLWFFNIFNIRPNKQDLLKHATPRHIIFKNTFQYSCLKLKAKSQYKCDMQCDAKGALNKQKWDCGWIEYDILKMIVKSVIYIHWISFHISLEGVCLKMRGWITRGILNKCHYVNPRLPLKHWNASFYLCDDTL